MVGDAVGSEDGAMVGCDVDGEMVSDAVPRERTKLEKKGYDADDGTDKLDGSEDGKMVGDAVGGTDSAKLEKKG